MKTKEEVLEMNFGSEYYKLKELDYLRYILNAMEEYTQMKVENNVFLADVSKQSELLIAFYGHIAKRLGDYDCGTIEEEVKLFLSNL